MPRVGEQTGREELLGVRRRHVQEVDPVFGHVLHERARVQPHPVVQHVHFVAFAQQQQRFQRRVERERRAERRPHPPPRRRGHVLAAVVQEHVQHALVLDQHTLRRTGGTGGVEHVRRAPPTERT
jgi:hypothetical protein